MSNVIAVKAINQNRKRDILSYLSLRYYLESTSSRTDLWAHEVAINLTIKNNSQNIFRTKHFKGLINGKIEFRDIYLLSGNDLISESALLTECAKHESFHSTPCVYSYLFSNDTKSVFQHYTNGLNNRYSSIKRACINPENEEIIYLDIKKFYPSISLSNIEKVWLKTCNSSNIPDLYAKLGIVFIEKYKRIQNFENPGLVIGPMFSHLLANIYLKEIDIHMNSITDNRYWRYVDDIVLVGNKEELKHFSKIITQKIEELGLNFHSEMKLFKLSTKEWLENKNGIESSLAWKWPKLIGRLKKFIVLKSDKIDQLKEIFKQKEVRLELLTYTSDVRSKSLSSNFFKWLKKSFYSSKTSIEDLVEFIETTRNEYYDLFLTSIRQKSKNELEAKSNISQLKYLVGRLIYVAKEKDLISISDKISDTPELKLQYEIIQSLITADISRLVKLGTNACQAASQVIKQKHEVVSCKLSLLDNDDILSLSIFKFHGLKISFEEEIKIDNHLFDFASGNIQTARSTDNPYLSEFIALHGLENSKHDQMLNTLFDENESYSFDVLNAGAGSSYY